MLMEGTVSHTKKDIQQMLDAMGASLSFYSTPTRLTFSARVRSVHVEQLLALIAEILTEPTFPEGELALMKKREEAGLALAAPDTRPPAGLSFARLLSKKGHPNWSETTDESRKELERISSKQRRTLHAKIISRRELIVSMAGDMQASKAHALINKYFSSLPNRAVSKLSIPTTSAPKAGEHLQPIEHKVNIDYMVGLAARITSNHPDYAPLLLGIQVLGCWGGFTGRLMSTVREKEGLTYAIYAKVAGCTSVSDGQAVMWAGFASQLFTQGKAALMREVNLIVDKGVSDAEARKHRELYIARTKVQLSNSAAFASMAHSLAADGRKMTYLDEFNKKISKLSAKEINKALKKYLIPNKLSESSAGPV